MHQALTWCTSPARPRPHIINTLHAPGSHPVHQPCPSPSPHYQHPACTMLSPDAPALPAPVRTLSSPCMHQALNRCTMPARPRLHIINTLHAPGSHPVHQPCPSPRHAMNTLHAPGSPHPVQSLSVSVQKMGEVQAGARWGKPVHQAHSAWCTGRKMPGASLGHRKHGFQTGCSVVTGGLWGEIFHRKIPLRISYRAV